MANFDIPTNPSFSTVMRRLEKTDPAAAELLNTLFAQLLENDACCNNALGGLSFAKRTESTYDPATDNIPNTLYIVTK